MYDLNMLVLMADHNRWMNEKLYAVCARLSEEERKQDLGAYFRSVHGTFNHLLLVDRLWLGRLRGEPFAAASLDQELYADYAALERERAKTDSDIQEYVAMLEPSRLAGPVAYVSLLKKTKMILPLGLILVHLFHHQTHHRGQVTTLITQLGQDFGETDMIYMPSAGATYFGSAASSGEERQ